MKMMMKNRNLQNNKGFSLVEMLLTVMLITGLLTAIFNVLEEYAEKELATSTAQYMETVALGVQDILDNPLHFQEVYALADAAPADTLELSINEIVDGFGGIPASTRLNDGIRNQTPMGSPITIMVKIADNPASTNDTEALEIIVATTERLLDERVRRAATIAGPYGGTLRAEGEPIRSAFASWSVNPLDLAGTIWGDSVVANPPSVDNGAYLVHYRFASFADVVGDYMFRVRVSDRPELNRMYANLNMGTHNIMGTDNLDLSGNLNLDGRALVNGAMQVSGNTTIRQGDISAGRRFSTNNMIVQGVGGGSTGQLIVDDMITMQGLNLSGQLNSVTANFRRNVTTSGQISSDLVQLQNGIASAGTINATALQGAPGLNVNVAGQMNGSIVPVQNLTVQSGHTGVIDMVAHGDVRTVGRLQSQNIGFNGLSVQTFGACDEGC